VYANLLQRPRFTTTVVMRSRVDPGAITTAARGVLHDLAPDVPPRFRTFKEIYAASLGPRNFILTLVAVFAATALLLAIAGVYGVMAYNVTRRRREIGVRIALGATSGQVIGVILGQGMRTIVIGVVAGLVGALLLTRSVSAMLFGITPTDPVSFAAVVLLLAVIGTLACYLPALRGTRVNPVEALRQE
jgi:ABC-type antimicrobial peptide transport system permease subunit